MIAHYKLDSPPSCDNLEQKRTYSFNADVFRPPTSQHPVKAIACTIKKESASFTTYVTWAQSTQDRSLSFNPASLEQCHRWQKQQLSAYGRLHPTDRNTLSTQNQLIPYFSWTGTNYRSVHNAILTETDLVFHTTSGTAQHAIDLITKCVPQEGFCLSKKFIYIFQPLNLTCLGTHIPLKMNTSVLFHDGPVSDFFQIPAVDLAFSDLVPCPQFVRHCYPEYKTHRCTFSNFVIASNDAISDLLNNHTILKQPEKRTNINGLTLSLAETLSSMALELDEEVESLRAETIRVSCLSSRIQLINLAATQLVTPSAVLSSLIHRKAFATMGTSTLQEIPCSNTTATLHPSLWIGGRFSARPILTVRFNNQSEIAQWTREGYLKHGIYSFMPPHPGHTIFDINGRTFIFLNGTLLNHGGPLIHRIGLHNELKELTHYRPEPSVFVDQISFAPSPYGFEYLQRAFDALSTLTQAQLSAFGITNQQYNDFTTKPIYTSSFPKILDFIRQKMNPASSLLSWIYFVLSKFWTTGATVLLFYMIFAAVMRHIRAAKLHQSAPPPQVIANTQV